MSPEFRPLTTGDDLEPELDLSRRAFGPFGADERETRLVRIRAAVADGRYQAGFDGSRQVASALYHDMRQWWHGRPLPMAGVAGVKVAPEERGRGVGADLMTRLLEQIARAGYPLAVLYPATSSFYRSLGWEVAGGHYEITLPARSLRRLQPPDPQAIGEPGGDGPDGGYRRAGPDDAARMNQVAGEIYAAARACGPATFDAASVARKLDDPGVFCFLAPDGLLAYGWSQGHDEILVHQALARSARTTRAWWSILSSHATMADTVRVVTSPADPVSWLLPEPDAALARRQAWMLRLVDAPAAIAGRGYPAGAACAVRLVLGDPQRPANAGEWVLEVTAGQGALTRPAPTGPADHAPLRLGARGIAALYAGTPMATLRMAGLAAGGQAAADEALDAAFAGQPYMLDYF